MKKSFKKNLFLLELYFYYNKANLCNCDKNVLLSHSAIIFWRNQSEWGKDIVFLNELVDNR